MRVGINFKIFITFIFLGWWFVDVVRCPPIMGSYLSSLADLAGFSEPHRVLDLEYWRTSLLSL